jgi:hypothetical protein
MVIYGYVGEADAYYYEYANGDNNGHSTSSLGNTSEISDYWIPEVTGKARNSDARISIDSDSDGLVNFDEEERFGTDPYSFDSDNDGIDDKTEIFSYTYKIAKKDVSKYIQEKADYDNDGIRAEKDPDSDGGGIIDGLEDLNSNGLYDNGESIVLDERDDVGDHLILDIPDDYTLYALGSLRINDGVKCYNRIDEDQPSCNVASFESSLLKTFFPNRYSLVLGARSFIGSANSRGTVFIRSGAHVYGNLNIYVMSNPAAFYEISGSFLNLNDYLTSQASSVIYGSSSLQYVGDWPNSYLFSLPDKINGKGKIVVKSGETFYLRDDFACDTLKVENGATLVVEPGEMYVYSLLLLEANSRIEFSQPGVSSILHIAGNCIWRPYRSESITDLNYWTSVAKGFKMIQHSSKKLFIEGPWGGTIYAPLSELILGQATKAVYGRFLGKKITVHQYTKVFRVDFLPNISLEVAQLKRGSEK